MAIFWLFLIDYKTAAQSNSALPPGSFVTINFADAENVIHETGPIQEASSVADRDTERIPVAIQPPAVHFERDLGGSGSFRQRPYSKEEIQGLIRIHSASYSLDPVLPLAIARCESGFRWDAKNPTSTASGVFQYLAATWANTSAGRQGLTVFDADANIRMAISHIAVHGTSPWNESKHCWNT